MMYSIEVASNFKTFLGIASFQSPWPRLLPNACWLLEIRCVMRFIFAICGVWIDLASSPGVVSASEN